MEDEQKSPCSEINQELHTLGQRMREVVDTAHESKHAQEFSHELQRGIADLRNEIEDIIDSTEVQRLGESVREAVTDVGQGDIGQQVRSGVLTALKELNKRIGNVVQSMETPAPASDSPPDDQPS